MYKHYKRDQKFISFNYKYFNIAWINYKNYINSLI